MKNFRNNLLRSITAATLLLSSSGLMANGYYDDCCCQSSRWGNYSWLWGTLLGAAAGAGAGYAAGNNSCKRGSKGETGPEGPTGPKGENCPVLDTSNMLMFGFDIAGVMGTIEGVLYISAPDGTDVVQATFTRFGLYPFTGGNLDKIVIIPAEEPKQVGEYTVRYNIIRDASEPTTLPTVSLNGTTMLPLPPVAMWTTADTHVSTGTFN